MQSVLLRLSVVGLEHGHFFGVGERRVTLTKAAELCFEVAGEPIVESGVFRIGLRGEGHPSSEGYVWIESGDVRLFCIRVETDVNIADMDCSAFNIVPLLRFADLNIGERSWRYGRAIKMNPWVLGVDCC